MFQSAWFVGLEAESAGTLQGAGCLGILEERIAPLNHAACECAVERTAVVVTLANAGDELLDVSGGTTGGECNSKTTGVSGDYSFGNYGFEFIGTAQGRPLRTAPALH